MSDFPNELVMRGVVLGILGRGWAWRVGCLILSWLLFAGGCSVGVEVAEADAHLPGFFDEVVVA